MPAMTTHEFDRLLAAFCYTLERAAMEPPLYFDVERIDELRDAAEDLRLSALENEANARMAMPDLDSAMLQWINWMDHYEASDE
jgi:hypothetical protein